MRWIGFCASAALLAAVAPALGVAQTADPAAARRTERSERFYMTLWWVQPSSEALGRRSVRDGEYVLRTRLLPPSLVRLSADAASERGGRVVLPAGTQLFGLSTSGPPIWCALARRSTGGSVRGAVLGGLVGRRAPSQTCLIDLDKDGRLDAFFSPNSPIGGVPNFSGYRPRNPDRLAPTAFEELQTEQIETEYFVGIRYEGLSMVGANPAFSISFGNERNRERLTETITPRGGVVEALGGEFAIAGREGETLEVDIRRTLPRRPFHVMQTISYR